MERVRREEKKRERREKAANKKDKDGLGSERESDAKRDSEPGDSGSGLAWAAAAGK